MAYNTGMTNLSLYDPAYTITTTDSDDSVIYAWDRQEHEPLEGYKLFESYYLRLGISRTLEKAWSLYVQEHQAIQPYLSVSIISNNWKALYRTWSWNQRAVAWDANEARIKQLEWFARQEEVKEQEWKAYKLAKTALSDGLEIYVDYLQRVKEYDGEKRLPKPPVGSLDLERITNVAIQLGRLPTGMPTANMSQTVVPTVIPEDINATRTKRWQVLQERLADSPGNVIEGVFNEVEH